MNIAATTRIDRQVSKMILSLEPTERHWQRGRNVQLTTQCLTCSEVFEATRVRTEQVVDADELDADTSATIPPPTNR